MAPGRGPPWIWFAHCHVCSFWRTPGSCELLPSSQRNSPKACRDPRGRPHAIELPAKCPLLGQASQWSHPRWFPVEQSKERLNCTKCPRYQASTPRRHPWKIAVKDESYTLSNTSLASSIHMLANGGNFKRENNTVTGFHQALLYVKSRHPPAYDWQDLYHCHLLSKTHRLRKDTMTANSRLPVAKVSCTLASLQSCTLRRKYIEYSGSLLWIWTDQGCVYIIPGTIWHHRFQISPCFRVTEPNIQRIFVPKEPKCGIRTQLAVFLESHTDTHLIRSYPLTKLKHFIAPKNEHSLTVRVWRVWMHLWWRRIAFNRWIQI